MPENIPLALTTNAIILAGIVGLRWGAARTGGAGYLSALLIAAVFSGRSPSF